MTPAERYIATLYEFAVDDGLDVEAIRLYLLSHGIARSPAQVEHDFDHVFRFVGYAAGHGPAQAPSVKEFDAAINRR